MIFPKDAKIEVIKWPTLTRAKGDFKGKKELRKKELEQKANLKKEQLDNA